MHAAASANRSFGNLLSTQSELVVKTFACSHEFECFRDQVYLHEGAAMYCMQTCLYACKPRYLGPDAELELVIHAVHALK